jgi:K+/H+ antiporter YhaU regulatory subunit KhtT
MKEPTIQIHDSKRRIMVLNDETGEKERTTVYGFIVKTVAKNGQVLQISEVFNDTKAVKTHIKAMMTAWCSDELSITVVDKTKEARFSKFATTLV